MYIHQGAFLPQEGTSQFFNEEIESVPTFLSFKDNVR